MHFSLQNISKAWITGTNVLFLSFENEFSGIMYSLFGGRQTIFLSIFSTKFIVKSSAECYSVLCPFSENLRKSGSQFAALK